METWLLVLALCTAGDCEEWVIGKGDSLEFCLGKDQLAKPVTVKSKDGKSDLIIANFESVTYCVREKDF